MMLIGANLQDHFTQVNLQETMYLTDKKKKKKGTITTLVYAHTKQQ